MIKSDKGEVEIKGKKYIVLAEFGMIVEALKENGATKKEIEKNVNLAFMSDKEKKEEVENKLSELFDKLFS